MSGSRNTNSNKPIENKINSNPSPAKKTLIDPRRPRSLQPGSPLFNIPPDILQRVIRPMLRDNDVAKLSRTCFRFYANNQDDLHQRALQQLLQAVVDDDRETVTRILDAKTELLLAQPQNLVIESKYTWQRFHAESAWRMAGMRGQGKMVKLLSSYVQKFDEASKAATLAQWTAPDVKNPEEKARLDEKNRKLREDYKQRLLQPLATVIANEPCLKNYDGPLTEDTEKALAAFRKTTLPDAAVRLDDYYDVEQLLIAAYETYVANFNVFPDWNQRYVFCIKVIGWILSLVTPELGKIYCESLWDVVENGQKISARAAALLLADGKTLFYRATRDSLDGLGGAFLVDTVGGPPGRRVSCARLVGKLCRAKDSELGELMQQLRYPEQHSAAPVTAAPMCVIS